MRIAVLSDIHGNLPALEAVLADVAKRGFDMVVNLGDILSGPLFPSETASRLMALDLPTIRGNHERQLLEQAPERMGASDAHAHGCLQADQLGWLDSLPASLQLGDDILLCHGTPRSDLEYFLEDVGDDGRVHPAALAEVIARAGDTRASLILCGHTHLPRSVQLPDGRLVVNPGSVGLQAYDDVHPRPHDVEAGTPHARYAVLERDSGGWSVAHIELAYDWETSALAATRHDRPDWAHALRHGRMPSRIVSETSP